jgi:hypothetical protein
LVASSAAPPPSTLDFRRQRPFLSCSLAFARSASAFWKSAALWRRQRGSARAAAHLVAQVLEFRLGCAGVVSWSVRSNSAIRSPAFTLLHSGSGEWSRRLGPT